MQQHGSKDFARKSSASPSGGEVKIQPFQNMVKLHIKLKVNDVRSSMVAQTDPSTLVGRVKWSKDKLFQNMVMLHIKLNGITNAEYGSKYFVRIPT